MTLGIASLYSGLTRLTPIWPDIVEHPHTERLPRHASARCVIDDQLVAFEATRFPCARTRCCYTWRENG